MDTTAQTRNSTLEGLEGGVFWSEALAAAPTAPQSICVGRPVSNVAIIPADRGWSDCPGARDVMPDKPFTASRYTLHHIISFTAQLSRLAGGKGVQKDEISILMVIFALRLRETFRTLAYAP